MTSLEHDPSYAAATRKRLDLHGLEARVILAPLVGDPPTYSTSDLDATAQFDLAFLDGPPGRIGRGPVLPALAPYLKPGAFIVLDDAKRDSEQAVWRSWCGSLPLVDAKLVDTDRGLAIAIWGP